MGQDIVSRTGPVGAPYTYELGATEVMRPTTIFAHWDGTLASGTFLPCVSYYAANGQLLMRVFPSTSVNAGGTADVTYAPFPGGIGSSSGGGGTTTREVMFGLDTPDASANGFIAWAANYGFSNVRAIVPALAFGLLGTWEGRLRIPDNYVSGGAIKLSFATAGTSGGMRVRVSTAVVADGVSEDTAYTDEAYVQAAAPGTARQRFTSSFTLTPTLTPGSTLNVKVTRDGGNAADTLAAEVLIWHTALVYTG